MKKKIIAFLGLGLCVLTAVSTVHSTPLSPLRKLEFGGRTRSYRLHVPAHLAERPALVVVLHGGGGTSAQAERHCRFSPLSDQEGFLVMYPEGVDRSWNDGRLADISTAHSQNLDDVGFLRAAVEETVRNYRVDPGKIYATGISNGGFMSSRLGAEAADLFSAIAPVVGGIPKDWGEDWAPSQPLSVMIVQGTKDPLVPYQGGYVTVFKKRRGELLATEEAVKKWCQVNGCAAEGEEEAIPDTDPDDGCKATRIRYSGGRQGSEVVLLRVDGGGHTWPGSSQYLPKRLIGPVCRDFDATAEIWRFFQQHARSGS